MGKSEVLEDLLDWMAEFHFTVSMYRTPSIEFLEQYNSDRFKYRDKMLEVLEAGFRALQHKKEYLAKRNLKYEKYKPEEFAALQAANAEINIRKARFRAITTSHKVGRLHSDLDRAEERTTTLVKEISKAEKKVITILDEWKLADKPLGDATRIDLRKAIQHAGAISAGVLRNKSFYEALELKLPDDNTVLRDVVSADEVQRIKATIFQSEQTVTQ